MKFSIVTISFNQANYLESCIKSVLSQRTNGLEIEYIVVDPGSTDKSREIILKYKKEINKIIFEKDVGPADGLNKGFQYATGEVLGYLNADDIFESGAINKVEQYFNKYPNADIIAGHCFIIDEYGKKLHKSFSHRVTPLNYLRKHGILIQPSSFFRKALFDKVKGFNINNKIAWDGELFFEMMKAGAKLKIVNNILSSFRVYSTSISGSSDYLEKVERYYSNLRKCNAYNEGAIMRNLNYVFHWISQPSILFLRLIDQLHNSRRII